MIVLIATIFSWQIHDIMDLNAGPMVNTQYILGIIIIIIIIRGSKIPIHKKAGISVLSI